MIFYYNKLNIYQIKSIKIYINLININQLMGCTL
jgi:hypothetical protein